ncbi:AAA family ATPase [Ureaplasma ceti]|uniref:Chromosome partition protein Smc n=1 Tax=Ureaplasma ceti TaxID=3119530 RepID=A0ABP9UBE0_9BACT
MVFLKKFHAEGFKSFANPVTLNFNETMIGIVGPNGSGKSNIVDALKWAMGEQSIKSLRGKEKTNLIFVGSKDMNEADYALVELTFDNTTRILHYESDEVKISRKLIRKSGESIFMINDEPARLKDIQEMFLDSGLTKGSLGIISQGTVNWFAEAKPEDRRHMFEEAAGIGRYTKQKDETLHMLEKATLNLERLDQYEGVLRRDIKELTKQAEKAALYKAKFEEMKRLDVSLSVQEVLTAKDELHDLENALILSEDKISNTQIKLNESRALKDKTYQDYLDRDRDFMAVNHEKEILSKEINDLNYKKIQYKNSLENNLSSGSLEERRKSYELLLASDKAELNSVQNQLTNGEQKLTLVKQTLEDLRVEKQDSTNKYNQAMLAHNTARNKLNTLSELMQSSQNGEKGVNTLLNAKDVLFGIHSTVSSVLTVPEKFEIAIQTALGKAGNNLIVDTTETAVRAINFLKKNNGGRATLLPLDTIKPKEIREDSLLIMSQVEGFIDVASNLVSYNDEYSNIVRSLIGNVAIADSIENANLVAKMVNYNYKVISLDGDIVFTGGALSGGQQQTNKSMFNLESKIAKAKEALEVASEYLTQTKIKFESLDSDIAEKNIELHNLTSSISTFRTRVQDLSTRISQNQAGYDSIKDTVESGQKLQVKINDFEVKLIEANEKYADLMNKYDNAIELRAHAHDLYSKYTVNFERAQQEFNEVSKKHNSQKERVVVLEAHLKNIHNKLSVSYGMTIDAAVADYNEPLEMTTAEAKSVVYKLKTELDGLGNINYEAVDKLAEKEQEYNSLKTEHDSARESVNNLRKIIDDLDKRAKADFTAVVDRVNATIPGIFRNLFGGGTCEIKYTDPQNVLESGIDVIVQPLGKKISNLVLLSGGEKTLVALTILFALLKSSLFPLVVLDEAEAALDQANVSTFAKLIQEFSDSTQFLVITHRTGTMKMCNVLYGTTMQVKGVTKVIKTDLDEIKKTVGDRTHLHENQDN